MTPADLINRAALDGLCMSLTGCGRLRLSGDQTQIDRYLPMVAQYQQQIIRALTPPIPQAIPMFRRTRDRAMPSLYCNCSF